MKCKYFSSVAPFSWFSITLLALFFIIVFPSVSVSVDPKQFTPHIRQSSIGWVDWDNGYIYGIGKAYPHFNKNSKPRTLGAARVVAAGNIIKLAAGMNLDDRRTLESLGKGKVIIQLKAFLRHEDYKVEFIEDGDKPYYQVILRTPITGVEGLTSKLLTQLKATPTAWNEFPRPPEGEEDGDTAQPWLVLDARNLEKDGKVQPALFPKIVSESGETIYEIGKVEEKALVERGMARYVESSESAEKMNSRKGSLDHILEEARAFLATRQAWAQEQTGNPIRLENLPIPVRAPKPPPAAVQEDTPPVIQETGPDTVGVPAAKKRRKKRKPFIVQEVKQARGLNQTNLVISEKDAQELKEEDAASRILKKCRVIVVVSSPIGGVEAERFPFLAMMP